MAMSRAWGLLKFIGSLGGAATSFHHHNTNHNTGQPHSTTQGPPMPSNSLSSSTHQKRRLGLRSSFTKKPKEPPLLPKPTRIAKKRQPETYNLRSKRQRRDHQSHHDEKKPRGWTGWVLIDDDEREDDRVEHPEEYPDLDFHNSFGSFLTRKSPVAAAVNADVAHYWSLLGASPSLLQHHIHEIGNRYRSAFRDFFTAEPISLHGHVSDASNPTLLTSLIFHLSAHAPEGGGVVSFLEQSDKEKPRVAVAEGSYGAGFGSLAYNAVIETCRPLGNGPRPVIVKITNAARIDAQVKAAKETGCVALITEIVNARDGKVVSEAVWSNLLKACKRYGLILVVDEALTSIRCGAPFAYQLPQYSKHGLPDLILYGKAIRTNGIAVEWRGINIEKLNINDPEDREFTILEWQERLTEMAPAADLLTSWGTINLAQQERWPQRSIEVGRLLREFIEADGIHPIGGLRSIIYLRLEDSKHFSSPVMGARAGKHVRWIPTLDKAMTTEKSLRIKIFGAESIEHRREISAYLRSQKLRLGFCSRCGSAVDTDVLDCEVCVVRVCEECEPEGHVCPMKEQ